MALDASTSYGAALGLQGTPKDYSTQFTRLGMQQDAAAQRKEQAKQAKKDKEAAETERLAKLYKVDIDGYLPNRIPVVKQRAAEFTNKLMQKRAQGVDVTNDPETINEFNNLRTDLAALKEERVAYQLDRTEVDSKPDAFIFDAQYNDYATGKASGDAPIYVRGAALKDKVDYNDYIKNLATSVKQTEMGVDKGGLNIVTKGYDPEATKRQADYFVNSAFDPQSPNRYAGKFVREKAAEFAAIPSNQILPAEEKAVALQNYLSDEAFKKFQDYQGESRRENRDRPQNININMGAGATDTGRAVGTGKKTFNINFKTTAGGVKTGEATSLDGATFKEAEVKATLPDDAISMINGERIKPVGVQKIRGGEMQLVYTYKKGTKSPEGIDLSGNILPDQNVTEGQLESGAVVPKLLFLGEIQQQGADGRETSIPFYSSADAILKNFDVISTSGEKNKDYIVKQYEKLKQKEKEETDKIVGTKTQQQPNKVKPGDVRDGYEFLGGDPNKQSSWRKIK